MNDPCAAIRAALFLLPLAALVSCDPGPSSPVYPSADFRPPALVEAGPSNSTRLVLSFDEAVSAVEGSLAVSPSADIAAKAEGEKLLVDFSPSQSPGTDYSLAGEVEDGRGNRTRFLIRFVGWNDRAPRLRISELQTGKNGSVLRPHRDFVELEALSDGNLGGEELRWASSVKAASYRFPGAEVKKGDLIVLHLAPEGLATEVDELGSDLSASGGVDSSAGGRDLWCSAMALPDESGSLALALRPGEAPFEGFFYADEGKAGPLPEGKLSALLQVLASSGAWPAAAGGAAWEDAFAWKASSSRPICRSGPVIGPEAWFVGASSSQSPGAPNPSPP